jgi:hypothetical protein
MAKLFISPINLGEPEIVQVGNLFFLSSVSSLASVFIINYIDYSDGTKYKQRSNIYFDC